MNNSYKSEQSIGSCPKCKSHRSVKHGKVKGRQRYLCKKCGYAFSVNKIGKGIEKLFIVRTLQLYLEGMGFRAIERFLGISNVTAMLWVNKYGKGLKTIRINSKEIEITEENKIYSIKNGTKSVYDAGVLLTGAGQNCIAINRKIRTL